MTITRFSLKINYNMDKLSANIQKLSSGRIDAIIACIPDMYQTFRDLGINPLPYEVSKPVAIHPDYP